MPYSLRITTLLESIRLLDNKIDNLKENKDEDILNHLRNRRNALYNELQKFNKLQWNTGYKLTAKKG